MAKASSVKRYTVTATLRSSGHTSAGAHTGYEVEVFAANKKDAISKARPKVKNMGWDRHEGPLNYTATEVEG